MTDPDELRRQAAALTARAAELETQLTRADLQAMTPDAIAQAKDDGRLNDLIGITNKETRNALDLMEPRTDLHPDLPYPKPLAKLIATADAAHQAWATAYADVVSADAALTRAPAEDQAALVAAVKAGKPHPGQAHEQAAHDALAVAEERCRVAREHATAQTDIVKAALASATEELLPLVLANVSAKAEAHAAVLEQIKATEAESRTNLNDARSAMSMIAPHLAKRYGVSVNWSGSAIAAPQWPMHPLAGVRHQVEQLEARIRDAEAATEQASA